MIRIIVTEDNQIVREGIVGLLNTQPDIEVVGEAENGVKALEILQSGTCADIVLADLNMPQMDGFKLIEQLSIKHAEIKVIILTMQQRKSFVKHSFEAGAKGYVLKDVDFEDLYEAIRKVFAGDNFVYAGF